MKTRHPFIPLAGLTLALMLAACADTPAAQDRDPQEHGSGASSAFLACLVAADVEARTDTNGMVLVKSTAPDGALSAGLPEGGDTLTMETDDAGNTWVAPADADYFVDDPDAQDAWRDCAKEHSFSQPTPKLNDDPETQEQMAALAEEALTFARCARENGFPQVVDPDPGSGGAIVVPDGLSESDFRVLAKACYDPSSGLGIMSSADLGFDPFAILDELESTPAS